MMKLGEYVVYVESPNALRQAPGERDRVSQGKVADIRRRGEEGLNACFCVGCAARAEMQQNVQPRDVCACAGDGSSWRGDCVG